MMAIETVCCGWWQYKIRHLIQQTATHCFLRILFELGVVLWKIRWMRWDDRDWDLCVCIGVCSCWGVEVSEVLCHWVQADAVPVVGWPQGSFLTFEVGKDAEAGQVVRPPEENPEGPACPKGPETLANEVASHVGLFAT